MIVICSFPRSGNHLTRFVIEYITGRPTFGCLDNPKDIPIFQNTFVDTPSVLSHVKGQPLGYKSHKGEETENLIKSKYCDRLLFIQRDPLEAILAYTMHRKFPLIQREYFLGLKKNVKMYFDLERYYAGIDVPKRKISYRNLISLDRTDYLQEIETIAEICSPAVNNARLSDLCNNFDKFRAISSQGKGRAWSGYRSAGRPDFHQNKVNLLILAWLKREIRKQASF